MLLDGAYLRIAAGNNVLVCLIDEGTVVCRQEEDQLFCRLIELRSHRVKQGPLAVAAALLIKMMADSCRRYIR